MALWNSLESVDFPRNLVKMELMPDVSLKDNFCLLSNAISTHTKYISRLHTQIMISRWSETPGEVADFTAISNLLGTAENITRLSFRSCGPHICLDIVKNFIACASLHSLTSFEVKQAHVSGSQFQQFIKLHAGTLKTVSLCFTVPLDCTRYSIAQGLIKLPHFTSINLAGRLLQKNPTRYVDTCLSATRFYLTRDMRFQSSLVRMFAGSSSPSRDTSIHTNGKADFGLHPLITRSVCRGLIHCRNLMRH